MQRLREIYLTLCERYRGLVARPPNEFKVPDELAKRLAAIGEDSAAYRSMVWGHGSKFVAGFIDKLEECHKLYLEWAPRLLSFAESCRKSRPLPTVDSLTDRDRQQQRIYESKLERPVLARPNSVAICRMPLIAIQVAQSRWTCDDNRMIFLTPEEEAQWDKIYSHPEDAFSWIVQFWWNIDDSPVRVETASGQPFANWEEGELSEGELPWLVEVGHFYGPLSAGGDKELWAWNGKDAKYIKTIESWVS
jgi:hypothetical protein